MTTQIQGEITSILEQLTRARTSLDKVWWLLDEEESSEESSEEDRASSSMKTSEKDINDILVTKIKFLENRVHQLENWRESFSAELTQLKERIS
jgi:chaperonin cofactor prefoldin